MAERTCIGCRRKGEQSSFLRVSRDPEGRVVLLERAGKQRGRSAYICLRAECAEKALEKDRLPRALKGPVTEAEREDLRKEIGCKLR